MKSRSGFAPGGTNVCGTLYITCLYKNCAFFQAIAIRIPLIIRSTLHGGSEGRSSPFIHHHFREMNYINSSCYLLNLGVALQIGFLRVSGRLLDAVRMVPPVLWRLWVHSLRLIRSSLPSVAPSTGVCRR